MTRHINAIESQKVVGKIIPIGVILSFSLLAFSVTAAEAEVVQLDLFNMGMGLFGGLALFLFGMEQMSDALKAAAGDNMKYFLSKLTTNRVTSALTGAFVTAVIQSSSVTTVLVVGFVSAGLMTMAQSIGVIMGANVGTTITAQIVAFKVDELALLMIAVGFGMLFLSKREQIKHYGSMLMGLGLVFFGMGIMSDAMEPLRSYKPFTDLMASMETPLYGILVAALFTALVQSSSATTGIIIVMASQGLITLTAGIALAFGANVGTCITAILAAFGKPVEAKRAAAVHVFFNVAGVLLWLALIPNLAEFVTMVSPVHQELTGTARLAAEVPRQIANAHTVFNVINTIIFLGFAGQIARLVIWLIPEKIVPETKIIEPRYLDDELIDTPSLALDRVRLELGHLGEIIESMLEKIRPAFLSEKHEELDEVAKLDDKADILHGEIMAYLSKLMKQSLTEEQNTELMHYLRTSEDLERIGDVIETDLVYIGHTAIREAITPTDTTRQVLRDLYEKIKTALQHSKQAIVENDQLAAQEVIRMKSDINQLVEELLITQAEEHMKPGEKRLIEITRLENELIDSLKRIYSLSKRISKLVIPTYLIQEAS
jgi:phosphate:Na+ symporter